MNVAVAQDANGPRVCLCVDDFGLHDGINHAVFALLRLQRVQAVSVMVGGSTWEQGARALRQYDPQQLDVGLHLDLTECPLPPMAKQTHRHLLLRVYSRSLDAHALRDQIDAQLDAFEQAMGRAPVYVDGHQHVHQLPMIRDALLQVIAHRYPVNPPWLRSTRSPQAAAHLDLRTQFKSRIIDLLGNHALSARAKRIGVQQNARLLGVYDFRGDAASYRRRVQYWLSAAEDGDVLMCHPGLPSHMQDAIAAARHVEFAMLLAPEFEAMLAAAQVRLLPMSRILANPR